MSAILRIFPQKAYRWKGFNPSQCFWNCHIQSEQRCHIESSHLRASSGISPPPPNAPHFGGLWEAAVKSAKYLLGCLLDETSLTFGEYATLFAQIEAVLNSRPRVPASPGDGVDTSYLTPTGFSLLSPPEVPFSDEDKPLIHWQRLSALYQGFWQQWPPI